jgi:hypothetical protein
LKSKKKPTEKVRSVADDARQVLVDEAVRTEVQTDVVQALERFLQSDEKTVGLENDKIVNIARFWAVLQHLAETRPDPSPLVSASHYIPAEYLANNSMTADELQLKLADLYKIVYYTTLVDEGRVYTKLSGDSGQQRKRPALFSSPKEAEPQLKPVSPKAGEPMVVSPKAEQTEEPLPQLKLTGRHLRQAEEAEEKTPKTEDFYEAADGSSLSAWYDAQIHHRPSIDGVNDKVTKRPAVYNRDTYIPPNPTATNGTGSYSWYKSRLLD